MADRDQSRSVATRFADVRRRIERAAERAGRDPAAITLVAVSKRQPRAHIAAAAAAGHRVFGENQVQEAVKKSAELPIDLEWHLVGHLQSNKTAAAVRLFSTIHSLDRPKIVARVAREAERQGKTMRGFLQVNLGAEDSKGGFAPEGLAEAVAPFARLAGLEIVGLMALPPYEERPEDARRWFRDLRDLRDRLADHAAWRGRPPAALSMGMSHDFEVAIEEGATHVRVGTSLFGERGA